MYTVGFFLPLLLYHFSRVVQADDMFPYVCDCPRDHQPVCGSDGETYFNECFLQCRKSLDRDALYHAHNGRCEYDWLSVKADSTYGEESLLCNCPRVRIPVCGSDGRTYTNRCFLDCRRRLLTLDDLHYTHYGKCEDKRRNRFLREEESPCLCPALVHPVCGSDGNTYVNECQLKCRRERTGSKLRKISDGVCNGEYLQSTSGIFSADRRMNA